MEKTLPLKQFYQLFTPSEKKQAWLVFFTSFLTALTQAIGIFSVFPFINMMIDPSIIMTNTWLVYLNQYLLFSEPQYLMFIGFVVLFFMIISSVLATLTIYLKVRFVLQMNHTLSVRLLNVYMHQPYETLRHQNTPEMAKNILEEVNHLTGLYLFAVFEIIIHGFMLGLIAVTLIMINPVVTFFATIFYGTVYLLINHFIRNRLRQKGKDRISANHARFQIAHEALSSFKSVKINQAEGYFINQYRHHSKAFAQANTYAKIAPTIPRYLIEGIAFSTIVVFILWQFNTGANLQTVLPLIGVLALAGYRLLPAIQGIFQAVSMLHFKREIFDKMVHLIARDESLDNHAETVNKKVLPWDKSLDINTLTFTYQNAEKPTLNQINLSIQKHHRVGIVGTTGSGKSTLIDVLMGLLIPQSGDITLDHKPLSEAVKKSWFQWIGYVPQSIDLIDDSIIKNIAFGIEDDTIDMARIEQLIDLLELRPLVEKSPNKLHTKIGEKGMRLSGGERQRLGIARALYKNPEILILDEATSAIDLHTERKILTAIDNEKKYTTIIVSHRPQTLKHCDIIYALEAGQIIKSGTYQAFINDINHYLDSPKKKVTS